MNSERRKDCPMRHPDNGNCLPAGGFCTAVNNIICDALHSAHMRGYVAASEKYTEVVRCMDCRKEGTEDCPMVHRDPLIKNLYAETKSTDFCSRGERKDNE